MARKLRSNTPRDLATGEIAVTEVDSEAVEEIMETDLKEILETALVDASTVARRDTSPETAKNVTSSLIQPVSPDNTTTAGAAIVEDIVEAVITTDTAVTEIVTTIEEETVTEITEGSARTAEAAARATTGRGKTEKEVLLAPAGADG